MTPRIAFEHELENIKGHVEEMGLYVEEVYNKLFKSVGAKDRAAIQSIMKDDRIINDMERNIESRCLTLITRQQPVARDLRVVSAALKVVTDLERAGDHVSDIGELALRFENIDIFQYSAHLSTMTLAVKEQIRAAVECFVNRDIQAAYKVIDGDDIIDDLFNKVKNDIIQYLKEEKRAADECIDILMIAKYLEKIGDHAVNIGEWGCFQETGNIQNIRLL